MSELPRDKLDICCAILDALRGASEIKRTHVAYGAKINLTALDRYCTIMEKNGLLEIEQKGNHNYYRITSKGREKLKEAKQVLNAFGLVPERDPRVPSYL